MDINNIVTEQSSTNESSDTQSTELTTDVQSMEPSSEPTTEPTTMDTVDEQSQSFFNKAIKHLATQSIIYKIIKPSIISKPNLVHSTANVENAISFVDTLKSKGIEAYFTLNPTLIYGTQYAIYSYKEIESIDIVGVTYDPDKATEISKSIEGSRIEIEYNDIYQKITRASNIANPTSYCSIS